MKIKAIIKLIDVKTLTASLLPVLLGTAYSLYAFGKIRPILTPALAVAVMLVQAVANMYNDHFDYVRGADGEESADENALASGEISSKQVHILIAVFLFGALCIGLYTAYLTSLVVMAVAVIGTCVAALYSSGPMPISYTPFGETASGITMGIGITATIVYIQSGSFTAQNLLMAIPTTFYIAYIMFTNNLCDLEKDRIAGRRTLPGLLGFDAAKAVWITNPLILSLITIILVIAGVYPPLCLLSLLLLAGYRAIYPMRHYEQERFTKNIMMGVISKIGLAYHALMITGLIAAYVLDSK